VRIFNKKTVILGVAVLTVFLLANATARNQYKFPIMERALTTVLAPLEYGFSKIGYSVRQAGSFTWQIFSVYRENQTLRAENEQLQQNIIDNTEIVAENLRLRAMLDYQKTAPQFDFVAATVIARDPGTWTNVIVINRGAQQGLAKNMPVVTPQGLVGEISEVFATTAKVKLLLDPRSAVGSLVQRPESRVAAIVEGHASNPLAPRMVNLARDADIIKGDKIITSGLGGIYPKGLMVGEVVDVINDEGGLLKYAVLKPAVSFDRLEDVMVLIPKGAPR
jgi:rod shape-determining protein MreC